MHAASIPYHCIIFQRNVTWFFLHSHAAWMTNEAYMCRSSSCMGTVSVATTILMQAPTCTPPSYVPATRKLDLAYLIRPYFR